MEFLSQQKPVMIKHWLYQLFLECVIYPSVWVAAGLASLAYVVQDILGLSHDWGAIVFIFTAAILPYNLDRLFDSFIQPSPDVKIQAFFRQSNTWLLPLTSALVLVFLLFNAPQQVQLVSCVGILPLMYGLPVIPWGYGNTRQWYRLKDIPGLKSWIVSGIISYALVAIPLAYSEKGLDPSVGLIALFLLIMTGTNAHLFDIRDIDSDQEKGVLTLPLLIGIRETRMLWTGLNMVLLLLMWFWQAAWMIPAFVIIVPTVIINVIFIWLLQPDTQRSVYSIGLDGCLFLPALLTQVYYTLH
jgi:4-hydroxybenzoate polyprenyltransferase